MLTFINHRNLRTVVDLSGEAIRGFLSQANASRFRGEAHMAIKAFKADPGAFSNNKLLAYGKDTTKAINHPARIEIRGATKEGAAQMVAKGIWGFRRAQTARDIAQKCRELNLGLHLKLAGTSSIEFNIEGVDKALPIRFLQGAFEDVLKEMDYRPGPYINSFKTKTVVAADGDGTIYDGPRVGLLPTLAESPAREALCAYLQAGGVFMLVSGNDINRTFKRLVPALPAEVYCRVLIAANGGAELVYVNAKAQAVPVSTYRKHALDIVRHKSRYPDLNMVYIGDDGSKEGNDYPGFKAVGFKHSVLVAREFLASYDPALKACYVGGLLQGTKKYLEFFLSEKKIF